MPRNARYFTGIAPRNARYFTRDIRLDPYSARVPATARGSSEARSVALTDYVGQKSKHV